MALRRRPAPPPEAEFATRSIDMTSGLDQSYLRMAVTTSTNASVRAWQWAREIGEVHYALGRGRKIAGYARLNAYQLNADGSRGKIITGGVPGQVASSLASVYGGRRGFTGRYFQFQQVPGDAYLIRTRDEQGNISGYDWLGANEIDVTNLQGGGEKDRVLEPNQAVRRITMWSGNDNIRYVDIKGEDMLGRVWVPADQFVEQADSPMRALDTECELLHTLTQSIKGKILSRFAMNGILYFPKELNAVISAAPQGKPGAFHTDTILNQIIAAMTYAVRNPDDPKSRIPIMLTGQGDLGKQIQQIFVDAKIDEVDMQLRSELIDRILMGLDVQPQQVKPGKETNHWQNWYQSDDERRVNVQPHLETMCWALTRLVLYPAMLQANLPQGRILKTVIGYDLVEANIKTNLAEDSRQLRDRFLIGDESTRRYSGATEEDAPTDVEKIRMFGEKVGDPYLAFFELPAAARIDWTKVAVDGPATPGPEADSPADPSTVQPGKGDPGSPNPADRKTDIPRIKRPA